MSATPPDLLRFLSRLGHLLLSTGEAVSVIEELLRRIAEAHRATRVNVIAFPTVLFVKFEGEGGTQIDFTGDEGLVLRFDQIEDVFDLARAAADPAFDLAHGVERVEAILASKPLYPAAVSLLGYVMVTIGIALVLQPAPGVVGLATALGLAVGALQIFARSHGGVLRTLLPTISAFMVTVIALELAKFGYAESPIRVLIASLVIFLPGGLMAVAAMDLAYGDVMSGSSRFVTGVLQLVFLMLGMLVAASLVGLPHEKILAESRSDVRLGPWAPWLGAAFFGVGHVLYYSSRPRNLPWILAAIAIAYTAQRAGNAAFGGYMGGLIGAIAVTPASYFIQYRLRGPPATVTLLPSLWLLLPSSLALIGLGEIASDNPQAGIAQFVATVFSIVAIAFGTLIGSGLYNQYVDPIFRQTADLAVKGARGAAAAFRRTRL